MTDFKICVDGWEVLQHDAQAIREQVFIQEQKIAAVDEWDAEDARCLHFVLYAKGQAVATARLLQNNSVGRVAVLKSQRGLGVGKFLMQYIIQYARPQREFLKLSSQVHAIAFYASLGFKVEGEQYLDCGIAHVDMRLVLR